MKLRTFHTYDCIKEKCSKFSLFQVDDKKESPSKRNRTVSSANYEATEPQIR